MIEFVCKRVQSIVGKGENALCQHSLLYGKSSSDFYPIKLKIKHFINCKLLSIWTYQKILLVSKDLKKAFFSNFKFSSKISRHTSRFYVCI